MITKITVGKGTRAVSVILERGFEARRSVGKALKQHLFPGNTWDAAKARGTAALAGVA